MVRFDRHNYFEFAAGAKVSSRIYRTFDVFFVHKGLIHLKIGRHRLSLGQGRAVLIYPQTLFTTSSVEFTLVSSQHFSLEPGARPLGQSLERLVDKENGFELAPRPLLEKEEWDILRALEMATLEQTPLTHELRTALLVLILAQWQPKPLTIHAGPRHGKEFRKLVEWLENNVERPVTLDEMASRVGLSSSQFRQRFKQLIGSTPAQFFLNMRMDRCKRLLLESEEGIKSVARAVGFSDLPHFYRNFKKHTGKTPDQFRRTHD